MRLLLLLLAVLPVAACATGYDHLKAGAPVTLSPTQTQAIQAAVIDTLKDPESARFSEIAATQGDSGEISVCGFVNAKNSFGGYVGKKPFHGKIAGNTFMLRHLSSSENETTLILRGCHALGIMIE